MIHEPDDATLPYRKMLHSGVDRGTVLDKASTHRENLEQIEGEEPPTEVETAKRQLDGLIADLGVTPRT